MATSVPTSTGVGVVPVRSKVDRVARKVLFLEPDAPRASIFGAQDAFSKSIALSAVRCLITYIAIPLLGPIVGLSGAVGPILGFVLGVVSMVAIFFSTRRFFAADHRWRWGYAAIGGSIFAFLAVGIVIDAVRLFT